MAENNRDFLLNTELNKLNDQLCVAVNLAVALRADEIEKFLEIYDSIPESIETDVIDQIKEMARQLAALPKKQFDMYRTKARGFGSGDHFNSALNSSINVKENVTFDSANHITMNIFLNGECKSEEKVNMKTLPQAEESKVDAEVKSSMKKKLKKKKKSKTVFLEEKHGLFNVEISNNNAKDSSQDQNILVTNKLLDPHQKTSRIATMKRTLVADICAVCCSNSQDVNSNQTSNKIWNNENQDVNDLDPKQESKPNKAAIDENYSYDLNDFNYHQSAPPFGFPPSANKLIESAVVLLESSPQVTGSNSEHRERQNKDCNGLYVQQKNNSIEDDVRQSTSFGIDGIQINCNESNSKTASISGDQITTCSRKCDTREDAESFDGDIPNQSALEDEGGWQSQARRASRKKKKELAGRNPRERNQVPKKDNKNSNFKKQSFKNNAINRNQSGTFKEICETYTPNNTTTDNGNGLSSKNNEEKNRKQEDVKEIFSYRDALLKTKPKSSDEMQYNSDSGVDVNSVGSCDSAIHSSKTLCKFDLQEAVNFLTKGCDEVQVRHKQGRVHYYSL